MTDRNDDAMELARADDAARAPRCACYAELVPWLECLMSDAAGVEPRIAGPCRVGAVQAWCAPCAALIDALQRAEPRRRRRVVAAMIVDQMRARCRASASPFDLAALTAALHACDVPVDKQHDEPASSSSLVVMAGDAGASSYYSGRTPVVWRAVTDALRAGVGCVALCGGALARRMVRRADVGDALDGDFDLFVYGVDAVSRAATFAAVIGSLMGAAVSQATADKVDVALVAASSGGVWTLASPNVWAAPIQVMLTSCVTLEDVLASFDVDVARVGYTYVPERCDWRIVVARDAVDAVHANEIRWMAPTTTPARIGKYLAMGYAVACAAACRSLEIVAAARPYVATPPHHAAYVGAMRVMQGRAIAASTETRAGVWSSMTGIIARYPHALAWTVRRREDTGAWGLYWRRAGDTHDGFSCGASLLDATLYYQTVVGTTGMDAPREMVVGEDEGMAWSGEAHAHPTRRDEQRAYRRLRATATVDAVFESLRLALPPREWCDRNGVVVDRRLTLSGAKISSLPPAVKYGAPFDGVRWMPPVLTLGDMRVTSVTLDPNGDDVNRRYVVDLTPARGVTPTLAASTHVVEWNCALARWLASAGVVDVLVPLPCAIGATTPIRVDATSLTVGYGKATLTPGDVVDVELYVKALTMRTGVCVQRAKAVRFARSVPPATTQ